MLTFFDGLRDITWLSVLVRMLFALICGGAVGIERSYKNRPAGFRTHILVCTGAAIASMTGLYLCLNQQLPTDLSRIGAQVVSGLGFIGGTVIVTKKTVRGLTTAAGLWATGMVGIAVGAGFYEGAVITTVLILAAEVLLADIGSRITPKPEFCVRLTYSRKSALDRFLRCCKDHQFAISNLRVTGETDGEQRIYTAVITLRSRKFTTADVLLESAGQTDGVLHVQTLEEL